MCLDDETFVDVLDGFSRRSSSQREAIEVHLDRCGSCRRHLSTLLVLEQGVDAQAERKSRRVPRPQPLRPGAQFGRYTLVKRLGSGASGAVWQAQDPKLGRDVAIKLIGTGRDPQRSKQVRREAEVLASLNHPNVVEVFDVGHHDDGLVSIVMELVRGGTLAQRIARDRLPYAEVLRIAVALSAGLAAAHHHQLVHRDIKPSNVLLGLDLRPRLADFGLAASAPDHSWPNDDDDAVSEPRGGVIGTPGYAAPEQLRGHSAGPAADVFSLGSTLWEAATGKRPFAGRTIQERLTSIANGPPTPHAPIPARLTSVLRKALHPNPHQRWSTAEAFAAALRGLESGARPRRRLALSVAVGVVGLIGAANLHGAADPPSQSQSATTMDIWERSAAAQANLEASRRWARQGDLRSALAAAGRAQRRAKYDHDAATEWAAQLRMADMEQQLGQPRAALERLKHTEAAADGLRLDRIAASARILEMWIETDAMSRHEAALHLVEPTRAALSRIDPDAELELEFRLTLAAVYLGLRDGEAAETQYTEALSFASPGTHAYVRTLGGLANAAQVRNDPPLALKRWNDVVALQEKLLGPSDPQLSTPLAGLGNAQAKLNDAEGAQRTYSRALALIDDRDEHQSVRAATLWNNLGEVQLRLERYEEALRSKQRALEISEATFGPGALSAAEYLRGIGRALALMGRTDEALEHQHRALILLDSLDPEPRLTIKHLRSIADTAKLGGDDKYAASYLRKALARARLEKEPNEKLIETLLVDLGELEPRP